MNNLDIILFLLLCTESFLLY